MYGKYSTELAIAHYKISDFQNQAARDHVANQARGQRTSWFGRHSSRVETTQPTIRTDKQVKIG